MSYNTYPANPWPLGTNQVGRGSEYELPTASANTLGGVKVGDGLTIADGVLSVIGGATGGGLRLYHETYTGNGEILNALNLEHTPVFVLAVQRTDHKVVMSPFTPWTLRAVVYYDVPNAGSSLFSVVNNNGALSVQGSDAGASCNTLNEEYEIYYIAQEEN